METHKRKRVDEEKGRPNYSSRALAQKIGMERLLRLSIMNYFRSDSDGMDVFDWKLSYEQRCVAFDTLIEKVNKWTQFAKQSGAIKSSDEEELIEEQRAEIENLKAEKKEMEVEIELLKEQQEDGIELIEEHRAEIGHLKAEHKEKIERLKKEQEDEIERMKNEMEVKIELLKAELLDKEESLEHTQDLNNILIAKERHHNDELQEVRKLLIRKIRGCSNLASAIGVKRMGELDSEPFSEALKGICNSSSDDQLSSRVVLLCSFWDEMIKDQTWHPYKITMVDGKQQELVDHEDKLLKKLKNEWGKKVYKAVVNALSELNEYNPSGRYPVEELWNSNEKRRATFVEGVVSVVNRL